MPTFNPQQEKEKYQREIKETLEMDWIASTSFAPLFCNRTMTRKSLGKVRTLREFFRSFIELMKDEIVLNGLCEMIDHYAQEREIPIAQRVVNQVLCKKRTNGEFILSAKIGEYDVENFIFEMWYNVNVLQNNT
jgi:hypothetical protein